MSAMWQRISAVIHRRRTTQGLITIRLNEAPKENRPPDDSLQRRAWWALSLIVLFNGEIMQTDGGTFVTLPDDSDFSDRARLLRHLGVECEILPDQA